ncbi:MAG TPA: hypothetical protein VK425_12195, partial [Acidimicrobiales bacterium]|nr:hypothetical protein [Acidimicrobiales bacterium]
SGLPRNAAIEVMRARRGAYDPQLLHTLGKLSAKAAGEEPIVPVSSDKARPGMVIAQDICDPAGRLLVGRGTAVTDALVDHLATWRRTTGIVEPVFVRDHGPSSALG